jgi:nicotinate-nucleotide adenylyltransferase
MLRLAVAGVPWAVVDDYELHAPPPSYSYLTAEAIKRRHPGSRLFWLMGLDQWRALPRWREPARLAGQVEFIVFGRDGQPEPRPGMTLHPLPGTHPASATRIRESFREGHPETGWLPDAVTRYIREKRLYVD